MSYEYGFKEYIRDEILSNINHMNILDEALEELDRVYAQAPKADEYEAKAKAFDAILKAYDEAFSREHMAGEVSNIIEKYESGESDAKK